MTGVYLTLQELSAYSRISVRQLRRFVTRAEDPLPTLRNGRRRLVLRAEFDAWIATASRPKPLRKPLAKARSLREIAAEVKAAAGKMTSPIRASPQRTSPAGARPETRRTG